MAGARSSLPTSTRKRKSSSLDVTVSAIQHLEHELSSAISTNSSLNQLADLLDIVLHTEDAVHACKAIYALYRVFITIIANDLLDREGDGNVKLVRAWLVDKLQAYVELLAGFLKDEAATLRTSALQILLSLQRHLSASLTRKHSQKISQPQFHASHFRKIVAALLTCPPSPRGLSSSKKQRIEGHSSDERKVDPDVRNSFLEHWLNIYDDIRWFFLREAASLLTYQSTHPDRHICDNLLYILEGLTSFPTVSSEICRWWVEGLERQPSTTTLPEDEHITVDDELQSQSRDDWRQFFDEQCTCEDTAKIRALHGRVHTLTLHQSLHSIASHKTVFTRAWLLLLPLLSSASANSGKSYSLRVLNILHRGVIPHLTRPILVMDWVSSCVDYGGIVGLLALNALFVLVKDYNLDYPSFYTRLYAFLDRDVLHLKHRARFFRLTELFLSSTHLPVALVASFIKRLSRLSLSAPPSAIVMIIPFTYNILRRHPSLMCMIHRTENLSEVNNGVYDDFVVQEPAKIVLDPFDMSESNPILTHALASSLWELYTHKRHYHAVVSTLVCIFEEAFTRPSYAMEDFLDHTYGTLYDNEARGRRINKQPAVSTRATEIAESMVVDLWEVAS
ncbi:hypothetical protein AcW1_009286 [Taiwanofungus camphoratus]|nr:hypothetical protein AcW1_009286 [Antrodia cinnamomea]